MNLEQKYTALLHEAQRRKMADIENLRLCFQTLSLASSIDRDCAHSLYLMAYLKGDLCFYFSLMQLMML